MYYDYQYVFDPQKINEDWQFVTLATIDEQHGGFFVWIFRRKHIEREYIS